MNVIIVASQYTVGNLSKKKKQKKNKKTLARDTKLPFILKILKALPITVFTHV